MSRKHHPTKAHARRAHRQALRLRKGLILGGVGVVLLGVVLALVLIRPTQPASAPTEAAATISMEAAYQAYQAGTFLLDVRLQEEWDAFHIPDTTLITLDDLESRLDELPRDERIIVVCNSGNRSDLGRDLLLENGFTDVTSMDGGVSAWSDAGYPIEGTRP